MDWQGRGRLTQEAGQYGGERFRRRDDRAPGGVANHRGWAEHKTGL